MQNNLWFNQTGETYNGIDCDSIYGGCPVTQGGQSIVDSNPPVPVAAPIPAPLAASIPAPLGGRGDVNGDGYDPGYLQVLADGSVVDANGIVFSTGTTGGLDPAQPLLAAGQRVFKVFSTPGMIGDHLKKGTVTGNMLKTLPAKYEIIWDNGTSSFNLASDVTIVSLEGEMQPFLPTVDMEEPGVALGGGIASGIPSCGKDKYTLPIQIGEEKCIDKTLALILGAIAIYYVMTKD